MKFSTIMIITLIVVVVAVTILYFVGKKAEKKQAEQQEMLKAAAQTVSMLIIDKSKMRMTEAGFPSVVIENTPKRYRRLKVPVVKAKVGPKIMTFMCDGDIYPLVPLKKEVKATISGIYITDVKGVRGRLATPEKKKGWWARMKDTARGK